MLAGLNSEERAKLNLEGCNPATLRYLKNGDTRQDLTEDAARYFNIIFFAFWAALGPVGLTFLL